jgi:hypothetical protein
MSSFVKRMQPDETLVPMVQGSLVPWVYSVYEANVIDPEGYKNNFLKVVAPKLEKHGIKYLV